MKAKVDLLALSFDDDGADLKVVVADEASMGMS
jgi:hypothetical protein